jgi:hypothetical protein
VEAFKEAQQTNAELNKKFLQDFYNEKSIKKMGFQLLKNTDVDQLVKRFAATRKLQSIDNTPVPEVETSHGLKFGF